MLRIGLVLLFLDGATERLGNGGLALSRVMLWCRLLNNLQQVGLELEELGGLQVPLLGQEPLPSWAPTFQLEADVEGERSQAITVQITHGWNVVHLMDYLGDQASLRGCEAGLLPLLFLGL